MNDEYVFFYDESGHENNLTSNTFLASNYQSYYIGVSIGIKKTTINDVFNDYINAIEKNINTDKEIKSNIFGKETKYNKLFCNLSKIHLDRIESFLDFLINNNILIFTCFENKIEFILKEIFQIPNWFTMLNAVALSNYGIKPFPCKMIFYKENNSKKYTFDITSSNSIPQELLETIKNMFINNLDVNDFIDELIEKDSD